jgi:hypothetical protein
MQIMENNNYKRQDHEAPLCIEDWGWKYLHIGIPTDKVMPNERYLPDHKLYVSGFDTSPFGSEWMRFDKDCPILDIIKSVTHIAFEVDDIDKELAKHNFEIITEPNISSDGIRAAMILHNGAPVELIEFKNNYKIRQEHELPLCIEDWGWKYHHLGIPTDKVMPNEGCLPNYKLYFSGFNTSPFGIEWMRFDKDCPISDIIKSVPHIAFEVDDIDKELAKHNFEILTKPNIPSDGIRVAMILHNGASVELIEFRNK